MKLKKRQTLYDSFTTFEMKIVPRAHAIFVSGEGGAIGGLALFHKKSLGLRVYNKCENLKYAAY